MTSEATTRFSGQMMFLEEAGEALQIVHRDSLLIDVMDRYRAHGFILAGDDTGRIVGIVPVQQIQERLSVENPYERARWEKMSIGALINVPFDMQADGSGVEFDDVMECVAVAEHGTLTGIEVRGDLFLSWRRLNSLMSAAVSDPLTGLMTRLGFQRRLNEEWNRATRTGSSVAVIVIDVDEFKPINDRFGHTVGDEVLQSLGHMLESTFRSYDLVARFGGDEFVALCLGCGPEEVWLPLRRVQQAIASLSFRCGDVDFAISATCGAAVRHGGFTMSTPDELFGAADDCLYAAKSATERIHVVEFDGIDPADRRNASFQNNVEGSALMNPSESPAAY